MRPAFEPVFPLAEHLGMVVEEVEPGVATARVQVTPGHLNPHGALHGAVPFAMLDTAMGAATMSVLDKERNLCASIDVQLHFCKAVFGGEVTGTVRVVQAGKRVVHLQGEVRDAAGDLVAFGSGSFAVLHRPDGPPAAGTRGGSDAGEEGMRRD